jgi:protein-S-isoprenylcysteine O-methyltransferase Ste14
MGMKFGDEQLSWQRIATVQIAVAAFGSAYLLGYCLQQQVTPLRAFGTGLAIVAFGLWATARIQLGKSFSVKPRALALVTRGIYSKIRNPIYVFSALWIAGVILALGRPMWLLIVSALIPMQVVRARREARVLSEKFGNAYVEYRNRTWF